MPTINEIAERAKAEELIEEGRDDYKFWIKVRAWGVRGTIDMILRLLEQEEITRSKARELVEACIHEYVDHVGASPGNAPWDKLNWCDCGEPSDLEFVGGLIDKIAAALGISNIAKDSEFIEAIEKLRGASV